MLHILRSIDHAIFFAINHLPHTAWSDTVALFLSGIGSFGIVWAIASLVLFIREEERSHWFFVRIGSAMLVSFIVVEHILKPFVSRARPSDLMGAIVVYGETPSYAFPSGHATMAFAAATVLSQSDKRLRGVWYTLACLISLSRIYLGKHYPLDIFTGMVLGICIGVGVWEIVGKVRGQMVERSHKKIRTRKKR